MPLVFKNDPKCILRSVLSIVCFGIIVVYRFYSNYNLDYNIIYFLVIGILFIDISIFLYFPFAKIDDRKLIFYKRFLFSENINIEDIIYVEIEANEIFIKSRYSKIVVDISNLTRIERRRFKLYF